MSNFHKTRSVCDCGNPATIVHGNDRICARCHKIESERRTSNRRQRGAIPCAASNDYYRVTGIRF